VLSDPTTYICLLYLALVTAVGLVVALQGRERGVLEYFLAGRGIGSIVLALSLGVTTLGAVGLVLLISPEIHSQGPALLALAVLLSLLVILGTVVAPRYLAARVMTTPDLIAQRFGRGAGFSLGVVHVLLIVLVRLPMILLGGSWVLSKLSGWEPLTTAMLILVIAGLYTTAGGFPSVVFTQALQGVAVILSVLVLLVLSLAGQPLVIDLSAVKVSGLSPLSVAFFAISLAIVALWHFWADQFVVQRVLSARGPDDARRGVLLSVALVSAVALLGLSIIGAGTILDGPPPVYPFAAMMGSVLVLSLTLPAVAGLLQSAAAMITLDVVRPFQRTATDLSLVLVGRLSTTGVAVVVLLLVSALGPLNPDGLLRFLDAHLAVAPPTAALFVGVLFVRRMTPRAGVAALFVGAVLGLAFMGLPPEWNLPAMTFAVISFALSMTALLVFSFLAIGPAPKPVHAPLDEGVESGHADAVVSR
jgi:solute:Na+ symporter, SSS family